MSQVSLLPEFDLPEAKDLDEFYTPPEPFEVWNKQFRFTLDPCATAESAKCARYFHAGQDGLIQSWKGERVFMNPPYSDLFSWTKKAHREMRTGCELIAGLYPATRSEQPFWQVYIEDWRDLPHGYQREVGGHTWEVANDLRQPFTIETRFIKGRIRFGAPGNPTGRGAKNSGKFPSVLVIWRRA